MLVLNHEMTKIKSQYVTLSYTLQMFCCCFFAVAISGFPLEIITDKEIRSKFLFIVR